MFRGAVLEQIFQSGAILVIEGRYIVVCVFIGKGVRKMILCGSPRFSAVTLEVGRPLPYVTYQSTYGDKTVTHKARKRQLRREFEAVTTIVKTWLAERKEQIDKITAGRNIKLKVMTQEDFDAQYTDKAERQRNRALPRSYGGGNAYGARIGLKAYNVDDSGKETKLQVRWPGNNPDGPFCPIDFQDWAEKFILKPKNLFNALTKALRQGVSNIGVPNPYGWESDQ
jgi:hypothetical protein